MIDCSEATRRLWEYLDDALGSVDHHLVDEHLARCRRCCGELEFARELRRKLATCCSEDMPDNVRHRLHETLDALGGDSPAR